MHPLILALYEENRLDIYLQCEGNECPEGVIRGEHILMAILEKEKPR